MTRNVLVNSKGMSLIEVMIAIMLLMIVSLAVMQTALLGTRENVTNSLRDEGVRIAEEKMNDLRSRGFTSAFTDNELLATGGTATAPGVTREFRSFKVDYAIYKNITDIPPSNKQITVEVAWKYGGKNYSQSITSMVGQK